MSKPTFPRNDQFDRWLDIIGASVKARRSTLPKDTPVYRI